MKSNCCKGNMYTKTEDEDTSYWICGSCGKACDPMPNKNTRDNRIHKEGFDAGYKKGYKKGMEDHADYVFGDTTLEGLTSWRNEIDQRIESLK